MNLRARFHDLQSLLTAHAALWRPSPFHLGRPPWCDERPALAAALEGLDDATVEHFGDDAEACKAWLATRVPELAHLPSDTIHRPWEAAVPASVYPARIVEHGAARDRALAAFQTIKKSA